MELILTLLLCSTSLLNTITTANENVCSRPELGDNVKAGSLQLYFSPGMELVLSCELGHVPVKRNVPRSIVCKETGTWTPAKLNCIPVQCPYPDPPLNGQMQCDNAEYKSTVNYTCDEGYFMAGASSAVCLADGSWNAAEPQCKPVPCGPAPIPQFGMIIYDKVIRDNNVHYGTTGTYRCLPPMALFGNERAQCTASGKWTETPYCQEVSCPPPGNIEHGFMSVPQNIEFAYGETVNYDCTGDYVLEGPMQIVCEKNGEWSQKPSCKAPCSIGIKRGRILYKGNRLWIEELKPNKVLHGETVSVYCLDADNNCGYTVTSHCNDGNLPIHECYEEPSGPRYNLKSKTLPSEIQQC